jgi:hypothetical protein
VELALRDVCLNVGPTTLVQDPVIHHTILDCTYLVVKIVIIAG